MEGNPAGAMGLCDYLGWEWKSKAGIPIVNVALFGRSAPAHHESKRWRVRPDTMGGDS
jgi:hypothetical protein